MLEYLKIHQEKSHESAFGRTNRILLTQQS